MARTRSWCEGWDNPRMDTPPDKRHLALFDLDGTLLPLDTNQAFGQFLARRGWVDAQAWQARNAAFLEDHHLGRLDLHRFIDFSTAPWRDRPEQEQLAVRAAFVAEVIAPAIPDAARRLVAQHQQAGDLVALVTGTNEFLAAPIAAAFGIAHVLAVQLERADAGRITGRILGIPSFHAGKVDRVHAWLAAQDLRLDAFASVSFYGDSVNDLPLLDVVSRPVAVSPSDALRQVAQAKGWAIIESLTA